MFCPKISEYLKKIVNFTSLFELLIQVLTKNNNDMRKFTLILALTFLLSASYGQKVLQSEGCVTYGKTSTKVYQDPVKSLKGEGDVFFSETFNWGDPDSPQGYNIPEGWQVVDENDMGHWWVWRAGEDSIKGKYTFEPGHIYSESPEDGYWVFPIDEYNYRDGVHTEDEGVAWFQLPPIDCSSKTSVILKVNQYFRACCAAPNIWVDVSNDQGVHWANFDMSFGTPTNVFCKKPRVELNLTEVAAGAPEVWIRFYWKGNRAYFWVLDDLTLSEGYTNELQLEDQWLKNIDLEEDGDEGFVYLYPFNQIGGENFGGYTFSGAFLNSGIDEQYGSHLNVEIFKNGESVYNEDSESVSVWPLDRDTLEVNTPYVPDGYGDYKVVMTAMQEQEDGVPSNNVYSDTFYINDSTFSYSDFISETHVSTAGHGNNDGDACGIALDIREECEANSISVFIKQRPENPTASTQPGMGFQYWIYFYDEEEAAYYPLIPSEFMEVEEEMINTWVTLPLEKDGESEFLTPGYYIAAIQTFHNGGAGADNNVFRFTIGADQSHKYSPGKTVYNLGEEGVWYGLEEMSMVMLNLNYSGAPSEVEVVFNCDMTLPIAEGVFTPGTDYLDVAGTFNGDDGAAHHLADADGDGIYTLAVPGLKPWDIIEYKYRINGNWATSEFAPDGPYRVHTNTLYNMLDDIYNDGVSTVGIDMGKLVASVKVYPNPSNGTVSLEVSNTQSTDLNITVSNIQGQEVYRNNVKSTISHKENINLSEFGKGLYFLKVNEKVTKLIIK